MKVIRLYSIVGKKPVKWKCDGSEKEVISDEEKEEKEELKSVIM